MKRWTGHLVRWWEASLCFGASRCLCYGECIPFIFAPLCSLTVVGEEELFDQGGYFEEESSMAGNDAVTGAVSLNSLGSGSSSGPPGVTRRRNCRIARAKERQRGESLAV